MGAITKTIDRVIPNEIKPILPVAAAMFGAPYLSAVLPGAAATGIMGALRAGAIAGGTNIGTQALMGQKIDPRSAATSALFAGAGTGLRGIEGTSKLATAGRRVGEILAPTEYTPGQGFELTGTGEGLSALTQPATVAATTGGTLSAIDAAEQANLEYERSLEEQGMTDAADQQSRRDYIQNYMNLAGFNQEEINDALSRYGYVKGGRVGFADGGDTLGEKMSDMSILIKKNDIIESGALGFDVKDIDTYSDDKIIEIHESLFGEGKAKGGLMNTRVGHKIGGSVLSDLFAKIGVGRPDEDKLNQFFEERKKQIFNSMLDPKAGTGAYSMEQIEKANKLATEQAMQELEEYKVRIGMQSENPPKGSMSDDLINQIMEPRKEGRVEEANGGRIKKSIGGLAFAYDDYLTQVDKLGLSGDPMDFEEFTDTWLELQEDLGNSKKYKKGGRIKYAEGGYSPTDYYDSLMYKFYLDDIENEVISPDMAFEDWSQMRSEENAERKSEMANGGRINKAGGGMMSLAMGGMPAEMDLRPGGFVPIGAKEKADDVPARLSKNEFVFTADAVRAAGGGSVNKGAQKMYDLMNSLEAKV